MKGKRKLRDEAFKRRYGIEKNEMGGGISDPELANRQSQAKEAGFKWDLVANDKLAESAKKAGIDEALMFNAYRRFREESERNSIDWGGASETQIIERFAKLLEPKNMPSLDEMRLGLPRIARETVDAARKALANHSEMILEHFDRYVKGKEDAGLVAAIETGGRNLGKEYLVKRHYPKSVAETIVDGYPAELKFYRNNATRIPVRPQKDLPHAALPLISSNETVQILTEGFGFRDIGSGKEHDLQRPKRKHEISQNFVRYGKFDNLPFNEFLQKALDLGILTKNQGREWGLQKSAVL